MLFGFWPFAVLWIASFTLSDLSRLHIDRILELCMTLIFAFVLWFVCWLKRCSATASVALTTESCHNQTNFPGDENIENIPLKKKDNWNILSLSPFSNKF